jgi:N-ethylmaleimide reductase
MNYLLSPYTLGDLELKNRVVMAPMTRSRTPDTVPTQTNALYYAQRAGAGLIVAEATNIDQGGIGGPFTPGVYAQEQVEGWKKVTQAVHEKGGKIFLQLWHGGRVSHPDNIGGQGSVAPSAIAVNGKVFTPNGMKDHVVPKALEIAEIKAIVQQYQMAAEYAKEAGFDGVELHAAFGYLPNQFLSDQSNQRTDDYGGSVENRSRFVLEIMEALCKVWPANRVGIRLAPSNIYNDVLDSNPPDLYGYLVEKLNDLDLAYLSLMEPTVKEHENPNFIYRVAEYFRPLYQGTIIGNGGLNQERAELMLEQNHADLIAFGQLYIANPDLVERFRLGLPLSEGDRRTYYGGDERGYIDYPAYADQNA